MPATMLMLENVQLALEFSSTGMLTALVNKLTGERYTISGDEFAITAGDASHSFNEFTLNESRMNTDSFVLRYAVCDLTVDVRYTLHPDHHFAEKHLTVTSAKPIALKRVVMSRPVFTAEGLEIICYRHPNYNRIEAQHDHKIVRKPNTEPIRTYFGRTPAGGFFTGIEMPFDTSSQHDNQIELAFTPSLKLAAGESLTCEPVYFGVYQRTIADANAADWKPADTATDYSLPLPSESAAMVAMTSLILGSPRHGLVAMACGWHSEMAQQTYTDAAMVEADQRSLDFLAECGVDWISDSHPWGGETEKMNALIEGDRYEIGPLVRAFLDHARSLGIKVVQWPTMNCTQPWSPQGQPFRPDRPDWRRLPTEETITDEVEEWFRKRPANCFAHAPFYSWIEDIAMQALATGYYRAWAMDGDFWGSGAYYHTTIPVECLSEEHTHLHGDANFACQRNLDRLIATVREGYPDMYIGMCRPPMDLGIWSQRNVDACFTLIETGSAESNIVGGDEIRTASRIRVHHHFFPHYLDWPLLFPSYYDPNHKPVWPSAKIDYLMLSALSCSPNLLLYLPTKTGIPAADKAEIRKWLDWGRQNIAYLQVRKDLPDWPAPGKVDGSAHILGDQGIIFLFNPSPIPQYTELKFTKESVGIDEEGEYRIEQEYPPTGIEIRCRNCEIIRWTVPGETAIVLRIQREVNHA